MKLFDDLTEMMEAWGNAVIGVILRFIVFGTLLVLAGMWAVIFLDPYISRSR